jgi:hypothetical protein
MLRRLWLVLLTMAVLTVGLASATIPRAKAAPPTPDFGPSIEALAGYDPVTACPPAGDRAAKPGVVGFRDLLNAAYGPHGSGISRSCTGITSEHWAGRALDWSLDASSQSDRAVADDIFNWLFATDRHGNQWAMARRLGIMYIIWNHRIWGSYRAAEGWRPYTRTPPHTDHIHFSFSRTGASKQTSYWTNGMARHYVALAGAGRADSYWLAASDGGVYSLGRAPFHDSLGNNPPKTPVVDLESTGSGDGYWLTAQDGAVYAFGAAGYHGGVNDRPLAAPVTAIARTPSNRGYWLAARDGGVFAFGDAQFYGSLPSLRIVPNKPVVDLTPTPSGRGYWLVAEDGGVFAFGDAGFYGNALNLSLHQPVSSITKTKTGRGYWLAARDGGVFAYGDAPFHGSLPGLRVVPNRPVTRIEVTPTGNGYWLSAEDGGVFAFGDAQFGGSRAENG